MILINGIILIIIGVLLFELMIFLHELGHFLTAKACGVKVNEFALGMGPKLLKFQKGETLYSLRAFPIGGFCSMEGEDDDSDDERAFGKKRVWQRMIIVSAGAIMNIILGLVLMMITLIPEPFFASSTVSVFSENASSSQSLKVGDEIKSIYIFIFALIVIIFVAIFSAFAFCIILVPVDSAIPDIIIKTVIVITNTIIVIPLLFFISLYLIIFISKYIYF